MIGIQSGVQQNVNVQQNADAQKRSKRGIVAGLAACGAISSASTVTSKFCMNEMYKIGKNLTADEFKKLGEAASKLTEKSGLAEKGVEVIRINKENYTKTVAKVIEGRKQKSPISKIFPEDAVRINVLNTLNQVKEGKNAFFEPASNKILIGDSKELAASVFHEAGHAMNKNLSKAAGMLQKCRSVKKLALPLALIALFHRDKVNENGEQSKLNKVGGFVKKHVAGLTMLSFLPMIAEEGLASLKGGKLAKQMLDPSLVKKVNKTNILGFATYMALGVTAALGAKAAVKISDKIEREESSKSRTKSLMI